MAVLLGSIKGQNDDLIKKIERVIAMYKKALKYEREIYSGGNPSSSMRAKLDIMYEKIDDAMNPLGDEVEKRVKITDKEFDYVLKSTTDEILEFWIKKLKAKGNKARSSELKSFIDTEHRFKYFLK